MSGFNMLNRVPYNVTVPEFQPERRAPIFPQITRKYPCIENIAQLYFDNARACQRLSWKIQQPDPTMVFTGVKLVLPLRMQSFLADDEDNPVDMRVVSKLPSANIALAETPMMAFGQTSLSLNGRVFSEDNSYRRVLDCCYRGSSPSAYGDNHSLKPVVIRNMVNDASRQTTFVRNQNTEEVTTDDAGAALVVRSDYIGGKSLDAAFSLLEHNGPFLERARKFQDNLSADGLTWEDDITSYLEVGPFQARARKGNTAVPYIRDLHLMLNFAGQVSKVDTQLGADYPSNLIRALRTIPARLFEFGTPSNLRHPGETIQTVLGFVSAMKLQWRAKPYLEVTYTKYIETMKPSYGLRCFERQYEKSNEFQLTPDGHGSDTQVARVTSRILSMPTKIYVYGELSDVQKGAWGNGGVRRSCRLKNLHCRINQRPDVVFNPSQEDCFEMFQRHTNSSLEYASWLKAPIYVFTPVDLGQPDMFANDARRTIFEWDAEVSMTPLQSQEEKDFKTMKYAHAIGYRSPAHFLPYFSLADIKCRWNLRGKPQLANRENAYYLEWRQDLTAVGPDRAINYDWPVAGEVPWGEFVKNNTVQFKDDAQGNRCPVREDAKLIAASNQTIGARGLLWAQVKTSDAGSANTKGEVKDGFFWYVPYTFDFVTFDTPDRHQQVNPWTRVLSYIEDGTDAEGDPKYTSTVDVDNLKWFRVAPQSIPNLVMNPVVGGGTQPVLTAPWKAAVPGPYAYLCDKNGLRNTGTAVDYAAPGPVTKSENGSTAFQAINQTTSPYRWAAFAPSAGMLDGTGLFANFLKLRRTTDPASLKPARQNPADLFMVQGDVGFNMGSVTGHGQFTLQQKWAVERGITNNRTRGDQPMNQGGTHSFGWDLDREFATESTVFDNLKRDYQLKVLYEFGNAQYEFSADAMPTKVLPNLVPVGRAPGIPAIM